MRKLDRKQLAQRVARDIPDGAYVNLGIGLPTLVANYLPVDREIVLHTENGLLGMGPEPDAGARRYGPHQRGQATGDRAARGVIFPSRRFLRDDARRTSRHMCARRVPGIGPRRPRELAHWRAGFDPRGQRRHGSRCRRETGVRGDGASDPKRRKQIVERCTYPLTGLGCVSRIYTDLAVIEVTAEGLVVTDILGDCTFEDLRRVTAAPLRAA